jgi:hypothetical protein
MKTLPLLLLALTLALAGCGGSDGETWGGYTESEAKDILADPVVKEQIIENAPGDPATNPITRLYPSPEEVEQAELRKVTFEGQESWQWRHAEEDFCILVWKDEEIDNFATQVSRCVAD